MRALDLKLLRDLGTMKGQMTAVAMVMICGLMVMIMERSLVMSLETTRDGYYGEHRFADVFCELKRAPNKVRSELLEIPDVAALDTRVRGGAILDIPGMAETAEAVIISIPDDRPQNLNLLLLRAGRLPVSGSRGETVVSEAFAKAHGMRPGDVLDATIYGARAKLVVVGVAISPEFVYELPPGGFMPDNRKYGVLWMNERELSIALALEGAFNSVVLDVAPEGDVRAIKSEVDRVLAPFGGLSAYDRSEHGSARMVDDEISTLRTVSIAFPLIFLSIAAFMTSAALTRLVRLQREQIAQLKAFGYSSGAIGFHYFKFALVVVTIAMILGGTLGMFVGSRLIYMYEPFFRFPSLEFHPDWNAPILGLLAGAGMSFLGILGAVRQAMSLPPAEAMRPEPPADFKPSLLERLGLSKLATPAFRMALRNLERRPWQAFFTAVGLALATAIPIVSVSLSDGMIYMMDFQWRQSQRHDVTLSLIEPAGSEAMSDIRALPGVQSAEPFRMVPARLSSGHVDRRIGITGLQQDSRLMRLLNENREQILLPMTGLLLSEQLAETLCVAPGDTLRVEVQEGARPVLETRVAGTITDYAGVGAYMEIEALRRLMGEGGTVSGAHLEIDEAYWDEFNAKAKESPRVGSVSKTKAVLESFDKIMGEMMDISHGIFFFFAVVVAFGVIYNGARIALSERTRDLATLRVLGFTEREVASVLIGELALLTLLALLPGLYLGWWLSNLIVEGISTELMRVPVVLTNKAYATSVLIVTLSSGMSFAVVARRIAKLDLLGVLKARE
ncbi:MAG: ABC transporter permease [Planctomycetes bacterium]|nr:ABC transporter permease [Planctomycetota bacterium]